MKYKQKTNEKKRQKNDKEKKCTISGNNKNP